MCVLGAAEKPLVGYNTVTSCFRGASPPPHYKSEESVLLLELVLLL